jgi:hypothetical protein
MDILRKLGMFCENFSFLREFLRETIQMKINQPKIAMSLPDSAAHRLAKTNWAGCPCSGDLCHPTHQIPAKFHRIFLSQSPQ